VGADGYGWAGGVGLRQATAGEQAKAVGRAKVGVGGQAG